MFITRFSKKKNITLAFSLEYEIINNDIICACQYLSLLKPYKDCFVYRCENFICRKRVNVLKYTELKNMKLLIYDI